MLILIDPQMQWLAEPAGKMGRPAVFSDTAIQLCPSVKVLFKLPLRQAVGMVRALLKLAGLDWPVPDYTTLCRRQSEMGPWPPVWMAPAWQVRIWLWHLAFRGHVFGVVDAEVFCAP